MSGLDEWLVERIADSVRGGRSPQQAYKEYCKAFPPEQVRAALVKFEEMTGRIRNLKEPTTLQKLGLSCWYLGPSDDDRYWPPLYRLLRRRKNWDRESVVSLDDASTKVLSLLQPPGLGKINTRGLVIGYVQSGKTANYSSVIAKAADVGYKFFIVLSGLTNPLRYQTQERLERELVDLNRSNWVALTGLDRDFYPTGAGNVDAFLTEHHDHKVLCVVKKNDTVLKRLLRWLKAADEKVLSNCPVLVIDDEADQASVNASGAEEKRTAINRRILDILKELPKAAYIGYTATPFANVFVDPKLPEDLYPRDFIISLPKPKGYFGAEQIFGREQLILDESDQMYDGLDMIRIVEDTEVPVLSPQGRNARYSFEPEITPSLEKALRYFWMATAARFARGDADKDSTMLLHTSLHIDVHELFREPVQNYRDGLLALLKLKKSPIIEEFRDQWNEEMAKVSSEELGEEETSFDELLPYLKDVMSKSTIIVENSKSIERLAYGDKAKIQIVIGGNTLARGLTLNGLVVSFFVRATNAYDTLLQMGRWFGYRPGYADLPRIWMTEELEGFFYDLATVEQEIRNDILRYEKEELTPEDFGVRIRTHPALSITSRLKMQAAIDCDVSYGASTHQTIFFKDKDKDWLSNNINATKSLISQIRGMGIEGEKVRSRYTIFRNVPVQFLFPFLKEYLFHEDSIVLKEKLIREYIEAQNKNGELLTWNISIVSEKSAIENGTIDLGLGEQIPLFSRPGYRIGPVKDYANLKAIVSPTDIKADLDEPTEREDTSQSGGSYRRPIGAPGLLLIYPISKDSMPKRKSTKGEDRRIALNAVDHIIGIGLVFPKANRPTPQRYKTVDLSRLVREEPEWPDEEESNL